MVWLIRRRIGLLLRHKIELIWAISDSMINILTESSYLPHTTYTDSVALSEGRIVARRQGTSAECLPIDHSPVSLVAERLWRDDRVNISELVSRKVVMSVCMPRSLRQSYLIYANFEGSLYARMGYTDIAIHKDGRIRRNSRSCNIPPPTILHRPIHW